MDSNAFLQRARSALQVPCFYWLGNGGWAKDKPPTEWPATPLDINAALAQKRIDAPEVYEAYVREEARSGIRRETLPPVACDCSGFVCWALNVPRSGWPGRRDWLNTDSMVADANGAQRWLVRADKAHPGALLVHPAPSKNGGPGHVAIVTEVDDQGVATRMLHCSARNYLLPPPPGLPRSAIAETDTSHFDPEPLKQYVLWKAWL